MRKGGGLLIATAAMTAFLVCVIIACAQGTANNVDLGEGGALEDGSRDVNVVPIGDGDVSGDTGPMPGTDSGPCTGKVVINEAQTRGATATDEFIELYNPNPCTVQMQGWSLAYKPATGAGTGSALYTFAAGEVMTSKAFYVLGGSGYTGAKDAPMTGGLADDGQIGLRDDTMKLIDAVGFNGSMGAFVEKSPAPKASTSGAGSIGRKPDGNDTDDNSKDFKPTTTPSPGKPN